MKIKTILLALSLLVSVACLGDTKAIAHRGFWKASGSAQNSLSSYQNANRIGCFGSEIDVWITTDGVVMVNHDAAFKGVTIETSTYAQVKDLTLANGENMPTLEEYLKCAKKGSAQLIIEIKSHQDLWRQNLCIDRTLDLVKKMKMQKRVDYIAFSYAAVLRLLEKTPKHTPIYYLNGDKSPEQLHAIGCSGPDYEQSVFLNKHPEWIEGFHKLGMKINVWTVDDPEKMQQFINEGVDYITTNEPEQLLKLLRK